MASTVIAVRTQGSLTILVLSMDLSSAKTTQSQSTHAHLTQAATILGYQHAADTSALVTRLTG